MKLEKKDKIYIFFIALLTALLVGLFVMVISGWFYKDVNSEATYLTLGGSSVIEVEKTNSAVLSYNIDGAILAGETLKHNISVKNGSDADVFVRAKLTLFSGENDVDMIELKTNSHWQKQVDGYYYFDEPVLSLATVGLCNGFIFGESEQLASETGYILTISVESLSTQFDRLAIWGV